MRKTLNPDQLGRYDPKDLTFAPWNPKKRIDATDKAFIRLVDSIRQYGQFMPALINPTGLVIDGNRRVAACQVLGIPVECVVRHNADAFKIYEVVNSIRAKISANEAVEIYAKEQRALSPRQQKKIANLVSYFGGVSRLNEYIDGKYGGSVGKALRITSFCKQTRKAISVTDVWCVAEWTYECTFKEGKLGNLNNALGDPFQISSKRVLTAFWEHLWQVFIINKVPLPVSTETGLKGHPYDLRGLFCEWLSTDCSGTFIDETLDHFMSMLTRRGEDGSWWSRNIARQWDFLATSLEFKDAGTISKAKTIQGIRDNVL